METDKNIIAENIAEKLLAEGLDASSIDEVLRIAKDITVARTQTEIREDVSEILNKDQTAEIRETDEEIFSEITSQGRSLCSTSVSRKVWTERNPKAYPNGGNSGFQQVGDERLPKGDVIRNLFGAVMMSVPSRLGMISLDQRTWQKLYADSGITSAVTIAPLEYAAQKPVPLSRITGNSSDTAQLFTLSYLVMGNNLEYADPTTGRSGNHFMGNVFLPRELAEKALIHIQKNPTLAREIFRKMEPEIISEQENIKHFPLPADTKMAVIPLNSKDAFEYEIKGNRKVIKGIRNECIVNIIHS